MLPKLEENVLLVIEKSSLTKSVGHSIDNSNLKKRNTNLVNPSLRLRQKMNDFYPELFPNIK